MLSSMAYPTGLRRSTGMARHSICRTGQRPSPRAKLRKFRRFALGRRVLGLQFHMEATDDSVRALLKGAAHEIGHGAFEPQPDTILAGLSQCACLRPLLDTVLDRLTGSD